MTEQVNLIPARLKSAVVGGHVAGAADIIDDAKGKTQNQINAEVDEELTDRYTKDETYNKTELNNLITTPDQEYVTVTATDQTTAVTDVLPATGAADTIYRVGNWDGTQYNTGAYTEYSWNGSIYVKLSKKQPGIDDEPTVGSDNLVKSSGIYKKLKENALLSYMYLRTFPSYFGCKANINNIYPFVAIKGVAYTFVSTGSATTISLQIFDKNNQRITGKFPSGTSSLTITSTPISWTCNTDDIAYFLLWATTDDTITISVDSGLLTTDEIMRLSVADIYPMDGSNKVAISGGIYDRIKIAVAESFIYEDSFPFTTNIKNGGMYIPFRCVSGVKYTFEKMSGINNIAIQIYDKSKQQILGKFPGSTNSMLIGNSSVSWNCNTEDVVYLFLYTIDSDASLTISVDSGLLATKNIINSATNDNVPTSGSSKNVNSGSVFDFAAAAAGAFYLDDNNFPFKQTPEIGVTKLTPFRVKKGYIYTFKNNLESGSIAVLIYDINKERIMGTAGSGTSTYYATPEGRSYLFNFDTVYYIGIYSTVEVEVTITVETGFVKDEAYIGNGIAQAACHAGYNQKNLLLGVITDLHGNEANFKKYMGICNYFSDFISGMLCMGDNIADKYADDFTFVDKYVNGSNVMWAIGNHDGNDGTGNWQGAGAVNVYNKFIKPYVSNWGVVQPSDAEANGYNYYYKDFTTYGIRLIVLDSIFADNTQATWLESVLEDARQNNLSVICTQHYPAGLLTKADNTFCSILQAPASGNLGYDVFVSKVSAFIDNGGEFITWLCGHWHADINGVLVADSRQPMFMFTCDTMSAEENLNLETSHCITMVGIDKEKKLIKLFRIGNDIDLYMRSKRLLCYNYETKELISNW